MSDLLEQAAKASGRDDLTRVGDTWYVTLGGYLMGKWTPADEIKRLRAERESFYSDYRMKCDEETKALAVEIDRLRAELENEQAKEIHSCHDNCTRDGCVNRRLRAELADLKASREAYNQECRDIATEGIALWKAHAEKAEAELSAIKGQIADPSWVCLEGMSASELAACDYGSKCCMDALRRILDGEDKGAGTCNEPWESLRRRVLAVAPVAPVADKDAERFRFRLDYIRQNINDNTAIRFALDARDEEIDAMAKG